MVGFSLRAKHAVFFHPALVLIQSLRRFLVQQIGPRTPLPFPPRPFFSPFDSL